MNQSAVLHKGLLLDCRVCNPPTETQEKRVRRARSKTSVSLDVVIRRQVAADLGEDEPKKDERFQLLQKYGVAAPRIDRFVTKPNWMGVAEWKRKLNDWFKSTKGLVAPQQRRTFPNRVSNTETAGRISKQGKTISPNQHRSSTQTWPNLPPSRVVPYPKKFQETPRPRDTREYPRNYGRTRTETPQS